MLYTQAQGHFSNSAANSLPAGFSSLKFRCRTTPQVGVKLLKEIVFSICVGVFPGLNCVLSLLAGKCRSIAARQVDPVEERLAGLEAADIVEDDRCRGRGVGEGGDVRGHDDARVMPERVPGRKRLLAEDIEHRR